MRQSMYENKSRRRDRQDDVVNVGTSRGASRRNKSRGEPIAIPSNKDEEIPHKHRSHSSSRIARMHTSQESRLPERGKAVATRENTNRNTTKRDTDQSDNEDVIEIGSDEESKSTKPKRRRLKRRISDDEDTDEYVPPQETATTSNYFKPAQPRRRTLHSPLGNYRLPTLSESVAKTSEYHGVKSVFSDDEDLYSNIKKKSLSRSSRKRYKEDDDDDEFELPKDNDADFVETTVKPSSPVILPHDPIDDYEIQPVDPDEHFLTFPFKAKKSVTVYERDYERLEEETYINDTLIDIFPKIWADEFPDASIYTFSSFFFTKLSGPHNTMNYDTVKRWTANEDIFKKKFLIIPIAQHNHWFLIVVMNPGYCIQGEKGKEYHPGFIVTENLDTGKKIKRTSKKAGTPLDPTKPYVVLLDPLHLNKPGAAKLIMRYLKEEAIQKLEIDSAEFIVPEVVMPACPGQDNFTDCGVFCLHYMKSLYQYTDDMLNTLYFNAEQDESWDKDNTLPGFRTHLKRMLKRKMKEYREYLLSKLDST